MVWSGNTMSSASEKWIFNGNWVEKGTRISGFTTDGLSASVQAALIGVIFLVLL